MLFFFKTKGLINRKDIKKTKMDERQLRSTLTEVLKKT